MSNLKQQHKDHPEIQTRTFALEYERKETDQDDRRVSVAFASEEPVMRSFGWEVLSHERDDMNLDFFDSGRAPLLLNHEPESQIGVIERVDLDAAARKSRAVVRFGRSELAEEIFQDVQDKIRTNISVGYSVESMEDTGEKRDGQDVYRVRWNPLEISLVSIPADRSDIGVGRAENKPTQQSEKKMEDQISKMTVREDDPTVDVNKLQAAHQRAMEEKLAERAKVNKEILALAVRHNKRDLADEAIAGNMELDEFRGKLLLEIESKPLDDVRVDVPEKEIRNYSFLKALNAASRGDWSGAGLESEMSQEVARKRGKQPQGFYVPDQAWRDYSKRELTVGTDASGGYFAPSVQLSSEWINALRAKMVLPGLGMRIMSGLNTKIQIPKISAGASAAFVAESGAVSDQTQTTAQITLQARTLGARTDVSRLLLLESDPSIEQIVRDDLVAAVADKIEDVMIEGGGSNEPTGITQTSGIGSVAIGTNGGAPTWASVVNLVKEVEVDNAAINGSTLGFLTNPKVKSKMASTAKVSSTDSVMILNEPYNSLYGYPVRFTTNVPSDLTKGSSSGVCSAMIFGDFSQLIMATFGSGPDVLVDPYSSSTDGTVRIVIFNEIDAAVRHAQSFAADLDYTTT